jgi:hypothetical protein
MFNPVQASSRARIAQQEQLLKSELYLVRVKQLDLYSEEHLRTRGVPSTGMKKLDDYIKEEWVSVYWSIWTMIEKFNDHITFVIADKKQSQTIFTQLFDYVVMWREHLENSINAGEIPMDLIATIDRMASVVFNHSSALEKPAVEEGSLISMLNSARVKQSFLQRQTNSDQPQQTNRAVQYPSQLQGISDALTQRRYRP